MVGMPGMLCVCLSYAMGQAVTHAQCSIYRLVQGRAPKPVCLQQDVNGAWWMVYNFKTVIDKIPFFSIGY